MSRRNVLLGVAAALVFFALGAGSARFFAGAGTAPRDAGALDAGAAGVSLFRDAGPKILFDPDSIVLLPDASLRFDPPAPPFDGGPAPQRPR